MMAGKGTASMPDPSTLTLSDTAVSTSENITGEKSQIIDIRVPKGERWIVPGNEGLEMFLMVHEQFTTDGSGGSDETFNLSNDLANSPVVSDADDSQSSAGAEVDANGAADLVVYDEGVQKAVVSVDYDGDSFDYADADTDSTLDVYYLWGDSSQIEGRKYDKVLESYSVPFASTAARMHRANVYDDKQKQTFQNQVTLQEKEHLRFVVTTDVDLANWAAYDGGGPNSTTSYSRVAIPVIRR